MKFAILYLASLISLNACNSTKRETFKSSENNNKKNPELKEKHTVLKKSSSNCEGDASRKTNLNNTNIPQTIVNQDEGNVNIENNRNPQNSGNNPIEVVRPSLKEIFTDNEELSKLRIIDILFSNISHGDIIEKISGLKISNYGITADTNNELTFLRQLHIHDTPLCEFENNKVNFFITEFFQERQNELLFDFMVELKKILPSTEFCLNLDHLKPEKFQKLNKFFKENMSYRKAAKEGILSTWNFQANYNQYYSNGNFGDRLKETLALNSKNLQNASISLSNTYSFKYLKDISECFPIKNLKIEVSYYESFSNCFVAWKENSTDFFSNFDCLKNMRSLESLELSIFEMNAYTSSDENIVTISSDEMKRFKRDMLNCYLSIVKQNKNIKHIKIPLIDISDKIEWSNLLQELTSPELFHIESIDFEKINIEDKFTNPRTIIEDALREFVFKKKPSSNLKIVKNIPCRAIFVGEFLKMIVEYLLSIQNDNYQENTMIELNFLIKARNSNTTFLNKYINFLLKKINKKRDMLSIVLESLEKDTITWGNFFEKHILNLCVINDGSAISNQAIKEELASAVGKGIEEVFIKYAIESNDACAAILPKLLQLKDENDIPYLGLNSEITYGDDRYRPLSLFLGNTGALDILLKNGAIYKEIIGRSVEARLANDPQNIHNSTDVKELSHKMYDKLKTFTEGKLIENGPELLKSLISKIYTQEYNEDEKFTLGGKSFFIKDAAKELYQKLETFIRNRACNQLTEALKGKSPEDKKLLIDKKVEQYLGEANKNNEYTKKFGKLDKIESLSRFCLYKLNIYLDSYPTNVSDLQGAKVSFKESINLVYSAFCLLMDNPTYLSTTKTQTTIDDVLDNFYNFIVSFTDWSVMYGFTSGSCVDVVRAILMELQYKHDEFSFESNTHQEIFNDSNLDLNSIPFVKIVRDILNKENNYLTEKQIKAIKDEFCLLEDGKYIGKDFNRFKTLIYKAIYEWIENSQYKEQLSKKDKAFVQLKILPEEFAYSLYCGENTYLEDAIRLYWNPIFVEMGEAN